MGVIRQGISIESFVNYAILDYCVDSKKSKLPYRTKKYQIFERILEKTSFEVKQQILKSMLMLPGRMSKFLDRLKALRDIMATVDFPGLDQKNEPEYKGESIYAIKNFKKFMKDSSECGNYLMKVTRK